MPHTNQVDLVTNQSWGERMLLCQNGRLVITMVIGECISKLMQAG